MSLPPIIDDSIFKEPTSKKDLKNNIREAKRILRQLDEEHKHDLGIHLYSSYLLHQMSPKYPFRLFTAWPMLPSEVPIPQNTVIYTNDPGVGPIDGFEQQDINIPKPKLKRNPIVPIPFSRKEHVYKSEEMVPNDVLQQEADEDAIELTDLDEGDSESDEEVELQHKVPEEGELEQQQGEQSQEGKKDKEEHPKRRKRRPWQNYATKAQRREQIKNSKVLTNPTEELKLEIDALFKRKIVQLIRNKPNKKFFTVPTLDYLETPEWVYDRLIKRLDSLIDPLPSVVYKKQPLGWQTILTQSGVKDKRFLGHMKYIFINTAQDYLQEFKTKLDEYRKEASDDDNGENDDDSGSDREVFEEITVPHDLPLAKRLKMTHDTYNEVLRDLQTENSDELILDDYLV